MSKGATAKLVSALLTGGLLVGVLMFKGIPVVKAHVLPSPCDFTTGGGFVLNNDGSKVNFGIVGGCKNGGFFGHVNIGHVLRRAACEQYEH